MELGDPLTKDEAPPLKTHPFLNARAYRSDFGGDTAF